MANSGIRFNVQVSDEKDGEVNEPVDEENAKGTWGSQLEFFLTCVGYAVGLGNVWRFPYLCFKNGGGAFLVPYFLCLLMMGIPIFYMEVCLGQYSSLGPITIWRLNPWFKGLGVAMVTVSGIITIYYAVIIAYCTYYFFASMTSELPWVSCDPEWSSCNCRDGRLNGSLADPWNGTRADCVNVTTPSNATVSPTDDYFSKVVLQMTGSLEDLQTVKWDINLCNLFVWVITFLVLSKGIKSLGKVVYFTAIFPYFLLTALLIRAVTLEGHQDGIKFYLTPDFEKLKQAEVWSDAAVQIFYSLGCTVGGLMAMSSYNEFHNNALRDAFVLPIINCLTSFYGGFVTFSVLGFMAHQKNSTVADVAAGGPGLAFIVYPEALAQMPLAPVWSVLFFFMMMILGFSSLFSLTETIITGIYDQFETFMKEYEKRIMVLRIVVCASFFVLGLPLVTRGGLYILNLVDTYVGGFPLLIVGIVEIIVVIYIYGTAYKTEATQHFPVCLLRGFLHFKTNIEMMLGRTRATTITFFYFGFTWCFVAPCVLLLVVVLKAYQYEPITLGSYIYPGWANAIGWLIVVFTIIPVPAWMVYYFATKDISRGCSPKGTWGPSQIKKKEWSVFIHPFKRTQSRLFPRTTVLEVTTEPTRSKSAPLLGDFLNRTESELIIDDMRKSADDINKLR